MIRCFRIDSFHEDKKSAGVKPKGPTYVKALTWYYARGRVCAEFGVEEPSHVILTEIEGEPPKGSKVLTC